MRARRSVSSYCCFEILDDAASGNWPHALTPACHKGLALDRWEGDAAMASRMETQIHIHRGSPSKNRKWILHPKGSANKHEITLALWLPLPLAAHSPALLCGTLGQGCRGRQTSWACSWRRRSSIPWPRSFDYGHGIVTSLEQNGENSESRMATVMKTVAKAVKAV